MPETILVTGGAGYLGSILCRELLAKGYRVRCFDRLYFGRAPVEELLPHPKFELVKGNIVEIAKIDGIFDSVHAVLHLAGLANDPSCDLDPDMTELANYRATVALGERARDAGVRLLVNASSCSVYGAGGDHVLDENAPLRPVSLYAETKARAEKALVALATPRFSPVSLRQATLFGYSPRMRFDLAINLMTLHAVKKHRIFVLGGGRQWRPFLHLRDAARAFLLCVQVADPGRLAGEILNVGSDRENYQIRDLAEVVAKVVPGTELEVAPEDEDRRSYHVRFEKIGKVLGWSAEVSAAEGAREVRAALEDGRLADPDDDRYWNVRTLKRLLRVPAREDGEPVRGTFQPLALPLTDGDEEREVIEVIRSGWLTTGAKTARLEKMLAEYAGAKHAACVSSCTAALHLSLVALGVGPGDEVVTTPMTWPATANVVVHAGATPVFCDIERDTLNMDPDALERAIGPRTKAIVPVHMAGHPCEMDRIRAIAAAHGAIPVIEDAAHAAGALFRGRKIGSLSEITCFSFYPTKNMTTGEGGAVITDRDEWMDAVRLWALHGVSRDAWKRFTAEATVKSLHPECLVPGFKYNMSDIQAAIGIPQLKKLDGFNQTRREYAAIYDEELAAVDDLLERPIERAHVRTTWHLYIVKPRLDRLKIDRDGIAAALRAENVGTGIHYRALHLHPYYRDRFGFTPADFPNATWASERVLSLPLYPKMAPRDVRMVAQALRKLLAYYKR